VGANASATAVNIGFEINRDHGALLLLSQNSKVTGHEAEPLQTIVPFDLITELYCLLQIEFSADFKPTRVLPGYAFPK